jgi:C4-type Zn-finger protein
MTIYQPATPYSNSITRPTCPRCGTKMMLSLIEPVPNRPDHDKRTFDCLKCGYDHTEVVKFK